MYDRVNILDFGAQGFAKYNNYGKTLSYKYSHFDDLFIKSIIP